jgi:hypothetical protein
VAAPAVHYGFDFDYPQVRPGGEPAKQIAMRYISRILLSYSEDFQFFDAWETRKTEDIRPATARDARVLR